MWQTLTYRPNGQGLRFKQKQLSQLALRTPCRSSNLELQNMMSCKAVPRSVNISREV